MERFKIGDRVKAVKPFDGNNSIVDEIGTIVAISDIFRADLGVEFDDKIGFGAHTCYGKGKDGHCWWCPDYKYCRDDVLNTLIFCGYIVKVTHDDETKTVTFIFWKE